MVCIRPLVSCLVVVAMCLATPGLGAADSDQDIRVALAKTWVYRQYLKDDAVKLEVVDGLVTLTGQVNEMSHKALAQEAAVGYPGVTKVDNRLEVKLEGTEKSDSWIQAKVRSVLALHRAMGDSEVQVDVKDGVITLRGEAANEAQRDLAEGYAGDIKEVVRVINVMIINPDVKKTLPLAVTVIDDVSVAALVRTALLNHRSTSSLRTRVQVLDGQVSIAGIAQSAKEKANVTRLVADLHGVAGVKNLMVIEDE